MISIETWDVIEAKERLKGLLPTRAESVFGRIKETLLEMRRVGEAPDQIFQESFAKEMMMTYAVNSPVRVRIASNVCCHGAGVQVGTYKIYHLEKRPASSPENFKERYGHYPNIYLTDKSTGQTITVGTMYTPGAPHGLGRAGGPTGWTKDGNGFGFSLASFKHNFEAVLAGFEQRAIAPSEEPWTLPNLVLDPEIVQREASYNATIVEPPSAVPPASYQTKTYFVPRITYFIGVKCDQPAKLILEVRSYDNKTQYGTTDEIEIPEGEHVLKMSVRGGLVVPAHTLNINPTDARSGLTVSYVRIRRL